ncbi:MAG TPA: zinc ribbon domain-containing protein [Deltaproteobacteria bacterium]|nr:zinc ribbon domain-containing protein [Deltaproteobacteria bacterium]
MKRVDHYISIFFLPVVRIKKGEPFLECTACGQMEEVSAQGWDRPLPNRQYQCGACGKQLEQGFRFCPFCGKERSP